MIAVLVVFGITYTGLYAYAKGFDGKVLPGVHIGEVPVGGMTEAELLDFLESMNDKLANTGIDVAVLGFEDVIEPFTLYPTVVPDDNIYEIISIDALAETDRILSLRGAGNGFLRPFSVVLSKFSGAQTTLKHLVIDLSQLESQLDDQLEELLSEPRNADVIFDASLGQYTVASSSQGITIDLATATEQLRSQWAALEFPSISLAPQVVAPDIVEEDLGSAVELLKNVLAVGSLYLEYTDPHTGGDTIWTLDSSALGDLLEAQWDDDGQIVFGLNEEATRTYLEETIADAIDVEAKDARFEVGEDGKVEEFSGSRPGVALDVDAMFVAMDDAVLQRSWHSEGFTTSIAVLTTVVEPNIKTGEINDLGVNEILGTGYSNFSGSPNNRIGNIRHAVENKLNGLLIKPDEEFSLLEALKPFTIEGGYLPELVIKGDEITPEVGGGLCQIGSTMFRTAMNSGMPITERRNHSLVVGYYNDPRNGLPGTDATIYENAPDFKFHNDTGHHLLITTSMNAATGDLSFTLWGTSDGRQGSYTEPVVHSWTPAGETRYIETTDLPPGEEKCQGAHAGAVASFDYVVQLPDGSVEEEEFRSHYRALPEICLVGVEELSGEEEELSEAEQQTVEDILEEFGATTEEVSA